MTECLNYPCRTPGETDGPLPAHHFRCILWPKNWDFGLKNALKNVVFGDFVVENNRGAGGTIPVPLTYGAYGKCSGGRAASPALGLAETKRAIDRPNRVIGERCPHVYCCGCVNSDTPTGDIIPLVTYCAADFTRRRSRRRAQ
jgi:hypothetical protein